MELLPLLLRGIEDIRDAWISYVERDAKYGSFTKEQHDAVARGTAQIAQALRQKKWPALSDEKCRKLANNTTVTAPEEFVSNLSQKSKPTSKGKDRHFGRFTGVYEYVPFREHDFGPSAYYDPPIGRGGMKHKQTTRIVLELGRAVREFEDRLDRGVIMYEVQLPSKAEFQRRLPSGTPAGDEWTYWIEWKANPLKQVWGDVEIRLQTTSDGRVHWADVILWHFDPSTMGEPKSWFASLNERWTATRSGVQELYTIRESEFGKFLKNLGF